MRKIKKILPVFMAIIIITLIYSFFNISGREIKFVNKLSDARSVTVVVYNDENVENPQYDLNKNQIKLLQKLIEENAYTRRLSSTIVGVLPDNRYTVFANWNDGGQKHLHISLLGGEYIQILGEYGNHYHKIKNPYFEKRLVSILNDQ